MRSVRRSLALSFFQRNATLVIQLVSSILIARLLTPHEIGIFSIGAVIVSFSHIVRDMGVSNYVIQEKELTPDRIRSAQSITLLTGWGLALVLFLMSYWAGEFYAEPGVTLTMRVLAISFLLLPVGGVTVALLSKEMAFGKLLIINISSSLTQGVIGVLLAWSGVGFISLAWAAVAGAIVSAAGTLICRRPGQPWLPGIREFRRVFNAGAKLSATSMFYEIGLGGPELIAGRILGFEAVAYFSRGFGAATILLRAIVDSFIPVAVSYFAKQSRSDQDVKTPYLLGIAYISVLAVPGFSCLAILAEPIILFLYGGQWLQAIIPLRIVCAGLACLAVTNVAGSVLVGSGAISTNLRMQAFFQPCKLIMVTVGAKFLGLTGVAYGVALGDIALSICGFVMANRLVGASTIEFVRCVFPSLAVALSSALGAWGAIHIVLVKPLSFQLMVAGLGASVGWCLAVIIMKHPILQEVHGILGRCPSSR